MDGERLRRIVSLLGHCELTSLERQFVGRASPSEVSVPDTFTVLQCLDNSLPESLISESRFAQFSDRRILY